MTERRLLPQPWRKLLLALHMVGGVGWMGLDVGLLALVLTGLTTESGNIAVAIYTALGIIVPPSVITLSLLMLLTGLAQGLWTKWGLLQYWWVAVKLVLGLILIALVFFVLIPAVEGLPERAPDMPDGGGAAVRAALGNAPVQLLFPPVVSFLSLAFALVLGIYKPWGKIRGS
ncbi:hypothetical protein [Arthrobacter sp. ISL-30]|uniref:hypothetical protein n=1 Tax=Arthrobacter sp. ISL-30 TaxID=2819109 RepID=UPI001BE5C3A8|nr:hypothetical protein [Arthrobacter sp. ISL-30]MBT2513755.1 hypothetical protein [Arthrobacter sp. ISL-30]